MTFKQALMLGENQRFADAALLLLRAATGGFLIYQTQDNVLSSERMEVFAGFLRDHGFIHPELMAPLSVYAQFLAGIGFIAGFLTRWLGLVTCFNFIVAVVMVHSPDPFHSWWPALSLVFLGLYFGMRGSGRYGFDTLLERRWAASAGRS